MNRIAEINDVLRIDVPKAITDLTQVQRRTGAEMLEVDWPCGLMVQVTPWQATVVAIDVDEEIMEMLYESGFNYSRRWS
jgi:hypothetical protein